MRDLILLVEDDPDDLELTLAAFEREGLEAELEVARDGEEVLTRLRGTRPSPALVLLDLNIPKLSGLEVLERMRQDPRLAGTPVVVFSSSDDAREKTKAAELGALAFVRKPFSLSEFGKVVAQLHGLLARQRKKGDSER